MPHQTVFLPMPDSIQSFIYDEPVAVIGDIHGCAHLLKALLNRLPPSLPVLVLGDLIDRGPDSKGVIELLLDREIRGVQGNHEEWFKRWCRGGGFDSYALDGIMGGAATLASYDITERVPRVIEIANRRIPYDHRVFIENLATIGDLTVMGEKYWMIHAGLPFGLGQQVLKAPDLMEMVIKFWRDDCLWTGTPPDKAPVLDRTVLMGHIPQRAPRDLGHVIAVDTGAGFKDGLGLTAVILPERRFVTVRYGDLL